MICATGGLVVYCYSVVTWKMAEDMLEVGKSTDSGMRFVSKMNGVEGKTPFLIGVAGGTASGKVSVMF